MYSFNATYAQHRQRHTNIRLLPAAVYIQLAWIFLISIQFLSEILLPFLRSQLHSFSGGGGGGRTSHLNACHSPTATLSNKLQAWNGQNRTDQTLSVRVFWYHLKMLVLGEVFFQFMCSVVRCQVMCYWMIGPHTGMSPLIQFIANQPNLTGIIKMYFRAFSSGKSWQVVTVPILQTPDLICYFKTGNMQKQATQNVNDKRLKGLLIA